VLRDPRTVALDTYYSAPIDLAYRKPTMLRHRRDPAPAFPAGLIAVAVGVLFALGGCSVMPAGDPRPAALRNQNVIESPIRTDQDRRMDAARHPAEFLPFTQVKEGMQVLDVSAGAGYTSQLLALAVGPTGKVWAQRAQPGAALTKRLDDHPQANLVVVIRPFENPVPDQATKLDLITLILNYHDITYLPVDRAKMNQQLFAALKPGGHFVVIDHSAKAGADISVGKTLHRIDEAIVVAEVLKAGFVLEAESDFLRDPADTREESSGDAKIPTDKFALRFAKP
jgi:predicted methyltransferase